MDVGDVALPYRDTLTLRLAKVCLLLQDDSGPTKVLQESFELGADFGKLLALGGLGESGVGLYLKQGLLQVRVLGPKLFQEAVRLGQQLLQLLLFRELEFDLHLTLLLELLELPKPTPVTSCLSRSWCG